MDGFNIASAVFRGVDSGVVIEAWSVDSTACECGTTVAEYRGDAATLLTTEHSGLNLLQRLSNISTLARNVVEAAGRRMNIFDTWKTLMLRSLDNLDELIATVADHVLVGTVTYSVPCADLNFEIEPI